MAKMKLYPILFLLFISTTVFSQNYDDLSLKVQSFFSQGNFGAAMVFAEQAAVQAEKEFGNADTMYAKALNNLAMIYQRRLRYLDAERTFLKTLKIKEKAAGAVNFSYATTLVNLADLYKHRKNYVKAIEYYQLAANIDKQVTGENSEMYAADLANIGRVYYFLEEVPKAINYLTKSLEIREKITGKDNAQYAINQVYLADVIALAGDFAKADSFYKSGLRILSYKVGTVHPIFLGALKQLSVLYRDKGEIKIADSLIFNGLSIIEPRYSRKSTLFFDFLSDLSELKVLQGDLVKAEEYAVEVYQGRKELLDSLHPDINRAALQVAKIFFKQDRFEEASIMLAEFFGRCLDIRQLIYPALSISDIQLVEKDVQQAFDLYNSIYLTQMESNDEVRHLAFNNYLILSMMNPGKYWYSKMKLDGQYLTEEESDYVFWLRHAEYYGNLRLLSKKEVAGWMENLDTVYSAVTSTSQKLSSDSLFAKTYTRFSFEWQEYLKTLKPDEATVVIIRGEVNTEKYPGEVVYAVLVLRGGESKDPEFLGLYDGNKLEEEVMKEYKKTEFSEKGKKFYKELWRDLNLNLKDKKKLYVKRSGLYLEVAIELLFDAESGKTLGEIYQIVSE